MREAVLYVDLLYKLDNARSVFSFCCFDLKDFECFWHVFCIKLVLCVFAWFCSCVIAVCAIILLGFICLACFNTWFRDLLPSIVKFLIGWLIAWLINWSIGYWLTVCWLVGWAMLLLICLLCLFVCLLVWLIPSLLFVTLLICLLACFFVCLICSIIDWLIYCLIGGPMH